MEKKYRMLAGVAVAALAAAAGCSSAPSNGSSSSGSPSSGGAAGSTSASASVSASSGGGGQQIKGCLVTDTGGIDDRSFNASAWKGMQDAKSSLGADVKYLQSQAATDYQPNINQFVNGGCDLIVTVGFLMGDDTKKAAQQSPDQKFAIVDFAYTPTLKNVLGLTFSTDQAAFLAGYLAAGMTKSGKVGTFGGQKIPPVTIYMDGFAKGVDYYNQKNGKNVQTLGWNPKTQNGVFTGDFTDQDKGKQVAGSLMNQGADIVFPVAGSVGLGAAAAVQQAGGDNHMIWVDVDGCVSAPQYCSLFLTSVDKNIATAVTTAMKDVKGGSFKGGLYTGTLQNGGVGLAPYHQFDSKIPASLKAQVQQLKQDIISGKVKVGSGG